MSNWSCFFEKRSLVVSGIIFNGQLCGHYFINHEIRIPSLNNQDSTESIWVFFVLRGSHCFNFIQEIYHVWLQLRLMWVHQLVKGWMYPFPSSFWEQLASTLFLMSTWNIVPQQGCTNDGETDPTYHEWSLRILSYQNMQEYCTWRVLVHSQKVMIGAWKGVWRYEKEAPPKKWYQQQCPGFCSFKSHLRRLGWVYALVEDSRNTCESKPAVSTN